ncbi:MAG TPA: sulfatase [Geminicoccaceae bacterium]
MRVILLLFDSLNRRALESYGGTTVRTPNFSRLAGRAVSFDTHYVGSLPCMPARRDLHTGRLNFLHRSWGPLEPFDNSFATMLRAAGIHSHLISDHYHYFEDGGWSYHTRYSTWDHVRGQEADPWVAMVRPPVERFREMYHPLQIEDPGGFRYQNLVNREVIREEKDFPAVQCFERASAFLEMNRAADGWLLQVETFDPHEPFMAPERFRADYPTNYGGPILDWPRYREVVERPDEIAEIRANYAALVAMCDHYLGRLMDQMDRLDLWRDTALIMTTDHGFMLGEHDWWGKNRMPFYDEIARIPLMIWHPDMAAAAGGHRRALSQTTDLAPTILDLFGLAPPAEARGRSLVPLLERDQPLREVALYGIFGGATNVTDGRYTYFRYPADLFAQEIYEYTLLPMHMHGPFEPEEFRGARLVDPFDFTKGLPMLRLRARRDARRPPMQGGGFEDAVTALYDTDADPGQADPIRDPEVEARLIGAMLEVMAAHDAPPEAYARLDLEPS